MASREATKVASVTQEDFLEAHKLQMRVEEIATASTSAAATASAAPARFAVITVADTALVGNTMCEEAQKDHQYSRELG